MPKTDYVRYFRLTRQVLANPQKVFRYESFPDSDNEVCGFYQEHENDAIFVWIHRQKHAAGKTLLPAEDRPHQIEG